jgi:hypothetical protein
MKCPFSTKMVRILSNFYTSSLNRVHARRNGKASDTESVGWLSYWSSSEISEISNMPRLDASSTYQVIHIDENLTESMITCPFCFQYVVNGKESVSIMEDVGLMVVFGPV